MKSEYKRLEEIVRQGYVFRDSVKYRGNTAYIYLISLDGKDKKNEKIEFENREEIEDTVSRLKALMKELHGTAFYVAENRVQEKQKYESTEGKSPVRVTESLKALDRTFAQQIAAYAKRQAWFSEVIEDVGLTTLFMALQLADVSPQHWYEELHKYKDKPEELIKFIDKYLVALFEAKTDAEKYLEMRKKFAYAIAENELLKLKLKEAERLLQELSTQLNACTSLLSQKQMQRYAMWTALRKMAEAKQNITRD